MIPDDNLGRMITNYRRSKGMTQQQLADLSALSVRAIRNLEAGQVDRPRRNTIVLLADALRLTGQHRAEFVSAAGHADIAFETTPTSATGRFPVPVFSGVQVGRGVEVETLTDLFLASDQQLVTITGITGVGKTRLAAEVARNISEAGYRPAIWLVMSDLSARHVAADMLAAPRRNATRLAEFFGATEALLVLDGVRREWPLAELLRVFPRLQVLVTSSAPLGLEEEVVYPLAPLPVPRRSGAGYDEFDANPAARLLYWHIRLAQSTFLMDERNACAVAELCRLLDGLPKALELAGSLCAVRSPSQLADRLRAEIAAFTQWRSEGNSGAQIIKAIAEDLLLLDEDARRLLNQLARFPGAFSVEDVAEMLGIDSDEVAQRLSLLVRHGAVRLTDDGHEIRLEVLNLVQFVLADLAPTRERSLRSTLTRGNLHRVPGR